jgi:UPF0716 protein FxsA
MFWLALLVLWPLAELELLVRLARATSVSAAILFVCVSAIAGFALLRHQGRQALGEMQSQLRQGRAAATPWSDRLLKVLAGILLIVPGVLSDVVGLLLLIPACRRVARGWLARRFAGRVTVRGFAGWEGEANSTGKGDEQVIDVPSRPVQSPRLQ